MTKVKLVPFPLYDRLSNTPIPSEINNSAIADKISAIRESNKKKAFELYTKIYAFCIHSYILNEDEYPTAPPYGISICKGGRGINVNLGANIPVKLLSIIHHFLNENISTS